MENFNLEDYADEDWNIVETTDYKNNAVVLGDKVDFSWDNLTLNDFSFDNFLDTIDNDDLLADLLSNVKSEWMAYYTTQVDNLPDVCTPGQECRKLIKEDAKLEITDKWQNALKQIRTTIENTIRKTKTKMESSWAEAILCEHGCSCEFIDNHYAYIMTSIENYNNLIAKAEERITANFELIDNVDEGCDFGYLEEEY